MLINIKSIDPSDDSIIVKIKDENNESTINAKIGDTFSDIKEDINIENNVIDDSLVLFDGQELEVSNTNKISINNATKEELCKLDGIGEKTALKIIEYRNTYGKFESLEELMEVKGIGEAKFNKIKEYITL